MQDKTREALESARHSLECITNAIVKISGYDIHFAALKKVKEALAAEREPALDTGTSPKIKRLCKTRAEADEEKDTPPKEKPEDDLLTQCYQLGFAAGFHSRAAETEGYYGQEADSGTLGCHHDNLLEKRADFEKIHSEFVGGRAQFFDEERNMYLVKKADMSIKPQNIDI